MAGRKVWAADDVLTAADLNDFLMDQAVVVFANASVRSGAILAPEVGMLTFRVDGSVYEYWNGSAWVAQGDAIGTVPYSTTSGTAVYATNAGTAVNANKVGNITIFNSSTTPTANATGDLWFY